MHVKFACIVAFSFADLIRDSELMRTRLSRVTFSFVLMLGKTHFLVRKIKKLFQHILDMLQEVPAFWSDYGHILRELLPDVEYRLRMGKKIYNGTSIKFIQVHSVVFSLSQQHLILHHIPVIISSYLLSTC